MHHHLVAKHGKLSLSFVKTNGDADLSRLMMDKVTTLKAALAGSSDDDLLSAANSFLRHAVHMNVKLSEISGLNPLLVREYQDGLQSLREGVDRAAELGIGILRHTLQPTTVDTMAAVMAKDPAYARKELTLYRETINLMKNELEPIVEQLNATVEANKKATRDSEVQKDYTDICAFLKKYSNVCASLRHLFPYDVQPNSLLLDTYGPRLMADGSRASLTPSMVFPASASLLNYLNGLASRMDGTEAPKTRQRRERLPKLPPVTA